MLFVVAMLLAMADSPLRLGIQALERKDFTVAVEQLEQATKAAPRDPNVWVLLAQARFGAGKSQDALAAAAKAEETGRDDPDVQHGLAFLYAEFAHDYGKAAAFEERYAQARPADKTAWTRVATLYLRADAPDRAMEPALAAFRAGETPATRKLVEEAYFLVSQQQLVKQDFEGAAATLEEARGVLKDSAQLELALGVALYGKRKFPEAVAQLLRTMELAPDVEQPYVFVGKIMEHAGDRMPALLKHFTAYQQRHPDSHLGYLLAAKALVIQGGHTEQALVLARQAIAKNADEPEAHFLLGTLLDERGELAAAATAFERSVALRNGDPAAHYRLARVYLKLGRKEDAARERALFEKLSDESEAVPR